MTNTTVNTLKHFLREKNVSTTGNKSDLEKKFRKTYNISDKVLDPILYYNVREDVKKTIEQWPSAYASGLVVQAYKKAGGKYAGKKAQGELDRWYKEKWVNVCEKGDEHYLLCSSKDSKRYPYCRPLIRINKNTPQTVNELSEKQKKSMCAKKRGPKRVFLSKRSF